MDELPLFAVSLAPPWLTAGAPELPDVEVLDDAVTADGVLMCGGAPEIVGVMLEAACVLFGVVGLATVLEVDEAVGAAVLDDAPLLVALRRGIAVFVDS